VKTAPAIIIALLIVAGCRIEQADKVPEIVITAHAGDDVTAITHDVLRRAGGPVRVRVVYADDFYQQPRDFKQSRIDTVLAGPSYEAAKVAAVMAANDITPLDVVTWLAARGQTVDTESAWWHPHWRAASGTVDYYVFEMKGAVRDTAAAIRVRDAIGAVEMRVRGADVLPDGTVVVGPWSPAGRSAGELLPGVAE